MTTQLRQRYGVVRQPHTMLPIINSVAPPTRSWWKFVCVVAVAAVGVYVWVVGVPPALSVPVYVTLRRPATDPAVPLQRSRHVLLGELKAGRVDMTPVTVLLADQEAAMSQYDLSCMSANFIGRPIKLLSMRAADGWEVVHMVNPVITWLSKSERSSITERSPLYPGETPVSVRRAHFAQVKFLHPVTAGESVLKVEGEQSHCVQAAVEWFRGGTVHTAAT
jgi:hypothetical protein